MFDSLRMVCFVNRWSYIILPSSTGTVSYPYVFMGIQFQGEVAIFAHLHLIVWLFDGGGVFSLGHRQLNNKIYKQQFR